jgi:hypothetical protein
LRELAELRLAHPDVSLRELGEYGDPPLTKSAVYHRVRRIEELAESVVQTSRAGGAPAPGRAHTAKQARPPRGGRSSEEG